MISSSRADIPGSTSVVESAEASLAPKNVGPPAACCASLCISPTTGVGGEGWLGLLSLVELDLVSFFDWPVWDLDASVVDLDVCFEDHFLLSPLLAPCFLPWGTSSVCEEGFRALESTCTSKFQMAFMWSVEWTVLQAVIPISPLTPLVGEDIQTLESSKECNFIVGGESDLIKGDEVFNDNDSAILSGEGF
ncbi:hypothetical protein Tco_0726073 [Tanacetum coccineum]|uniref:Uncharacterized protein n=1 Tax=Tanacetum coccineum TaxID=301880 RepID=A0ABQ4YGX0_9ASTR